MNTTLSLSAFAVALAVSGQAFADLATKRRVVDAIMTAQGNVAIDYTMTKTSPTFGETDSETNDRYPNDTDFQGADWVEGADTTDPCDYAGIICDNTADKNITNIQLPNANLRMTAKQFFEALKPVAGTLRTISYAYGPKPGATPGTTKTTDINKITGPMPDLSAFTQLRVLVVSNASTSGVIPDMSALTELEYVDLSDSAFTGITGQIGGDKLEVLKIGGNLSLVADLTPTLDASANSLRRLHAENSPVHGQIPDYSDNTRLTHFIVNDSALGGILKLNDAIRSTLETSSNLTLNNTGIAAAANTTNPDKYNPATGQSTISSANAGDTAGTIDVAWSAATDANGYRVQISDDGGETWTWVESGSIKFPTKTTATVSGLDAGNYKVRVIPFEWNKPNEVAFQVHGAASPASESITVTADSGTTGGTTTGGTTGGGTTTSGTTGGGGGGGDGAAWWLLALPFLARRRRAC